ncbi:hypothetical protein GGI25_000966 [Coemansia spiralis]|uniref:Zn(2)-C6 fungal-type domain-containing protein n=2 Tax=Coemansia TaxID=4863 RepID=A0A9W8L0R7_9FUNG|nr:hypothetical protein BX070DRAFT_87746 [Coemansia spiralis]KAJ1993823.1 hypothetical protein EDC05_001984 [Coemansia umbellata]KAJ2623200.1 hypothetical protein GGI26_002615 [Coemansia sp. RSA 1358]KAJ2680077.1 hypothetical protein GGI25_000966 [Coemansia spiralis]
MSSLAADETSQLSQDTTVPSSTSTEALSDSPSAGADMLHLLDADFPSDVPLLRSCENCRRKKRKCSGTKPTCTRCKAQGETCLYRPTARYFKPRASGSGSSHRHSGTTKKRASVGHVSPASNGAMSSKSRFHYTNGSADSCNDSRRPRAMSAVAAAALGSVPGNHMRQHAVQDGSQQLGFGMATLAPADLMLNTTMAGTPTDILLTPSTPSYAHLGSARAEALQQAAHFSKYQNDQQQQYIQMQQQQRKMGFGNSSNSSSSGGLAYMVPPVGDEDMSGASSMYYASPSSNSTPPNMLLNMEFSFGQQPSAPILLSSMAASMSGTTAIASPTSVSAQQQLLYPQNVVGPVSGIALSSTPGVVSSPKPMVADGDLVALLSGTMGGQQSAASAMKASSASMGAAGTCGPLMYSPPLSAMSLGTGLSCSPSLPDYTASYPLYPTTTAAVAAAVVAASGGLWSAADEMGTLLAPHSASLEQQPTYNSTSQLKMSAADGGMGSSVASLNTDTSANSLMAGAGLDLILPQSKNLFSEWLA